MIGTNLRHLEGQCRFEVETFLQDKQKIPGMLTHFGNFLCGIGEKGPFKTDFSLWHTALESALFLHLDLFKPCFFKKKKEGGKNHLLLFGAGVHNGFD